MSWFKNKKEKKKYDETDQHFWDSGTNICDPKKKVYKKHWRDYKNTKGSSWLPECEASKNIVDRCAYFDKSYASQDHPGLIQNQGLGAHALAYGLPNEVDPKTGKLNSKKYPASREFDKLQKSGKLDKEHVLPWKQLLPLCTEETCDRPRHTIHELWRVSGIKAFLNKCKEKDPTMVPYWSKGISLHEPYHDKEYEKELQRLRNFEDSIRPKRWWRGGKTKNRKTKKSQIRKKKTRHKKKTKNAKEKKVKKMISKGSKKLRGSKRLKRSKRIPSLI